MYCDRSTIFSEKNKRKKRRRERERERERECISTAHVVMIFLYHFTAIVTIDVHLWSISSLPTKVPVSERPIGCYHMVLGDQLDVAVMWKITLTGRLLKVKKSAVNLIKHKQWNIHTVHVPTYLNKRFRRMLTEMDNCVFKLEYLYINIPFSSHIRNLRLQT